MIFRVEWKRSSVNETYRKTINLTNGISLNRKIKKKECAADRSHPISYFYGCYTYERELSFLKLKMMGRKYNKACSFCIISYQYKIIADRNLTFSFGFFLRSFLLSLPMFSFIPSPRFVCFIIERKKPRKISEIGGNWVEMGRQIYFKVNANYASLFLLCVVCFTLKKKKFIFGGFSLSS